ncbi:helix-turn-helix transcriptional regulator [Streptomyces dengpaensis]|uniref:Helix-turn-helix transcriptional regulator n=2 Tax=Streptomyces TaxID=1883 RepID=A0ABN5I7H6_9ACTN|nr:helix-turn-helix transcriptional regulator [Streptomyces dengpaensis]
MRIIEGTLATGRVPTATATIAPLAAHPAGTVLIGPPGVGKTRLAREALADAARRGALTHWAVGTPTARAVPLGAFAAWAAPGDTGPAEALHRTLQAMCRGAGRGGLVVGVDDAHLLDDLSALLVQQLALEGAAGLVVTVRSGVPVPEAVTGLWKGGRLRRLDVPPLGLQECAELLTAVLGGPLDAVSAERLWRLTEGNALFLRHLVEGERASGGLYEAAETWRWKGVATVTPALADLVAASMGELPDAVGEIVDLLALGEPLGTRLLSGLVSPGAADAVEAAEERGLLTVVEDDGRLLARLAHPLYGEVRRARMRRLRGRRLRGMLARALEPSDTAEAAEPPTHLLRRALLRLDSDLPPDARLSLRAAGQAALLVDMPLAERLARAALAAGAGFPAQLIVTTAVMAHTRADDLPAELGVLTDLARSDLEHVQAAVPQILGLALVAQDTAGALDALAATATHLHDPVAHRYLAAIRSYLRLLAAAGDTDALHDAATAAPAGTATGAPEPVLLANLTRTVAHAVRGQSRLARDSAAQARAAMARSWQLGFLRIPLSLAEVAGEWLAGRTEEAVALALAYRTVDVNIPFGAELSGCVLGEALLEQGRPGDAERLLRDAVGGLREHGNAGGFLLFALVALARAHALRGRMGAARRTLAQAESVHSPTFAVRDPELWVTRAWTAAAEGALSEALAHARTGAKLAAARGHPGYEVWALHCAVRLGDAGRATAERLAELAEEVDGPAGRGAARHAAALHADDGEALRAAADDLARTGAPVAAADAHAQAADAFQRAGRAGSASTAAAAADRLVTACQGVRTPALLAWARPLPLTRREREIALLAAAGLSNQQIADRLTVSVRTVEGHLYRLSAKLGVASRTELAHLLEPPPPEPA